MNDTVFNKIWEQYKEYNDHTKLWSKNVREFIKYQNKFIDEVEEEEFVDYENVTEYVFQKFVDTLDVDEDEFDGPNDLEPHEWEIFDMIIVHYAKQLSE
jgi:hypothetical protein